MRWEVLKEEYGKVWKSQSLYVGEDITNLRLDSNETIKCEFYKYLGTNFNKEDKQIRKSLNGNTVELRYKKVRKCHD